MKGSLQKRHILASLIFIRANVIFNQAYINDCSTLLQM